MNNSQSPTGFPLCDDDRMTPEMVEIYRKKTPTERLQIAFGMFRSGQKIVAAAVKKQLPDATDAERQREVARRISHGLV